MHIAVDQRTEAQVEKEVRELLADARSPFVLSEFHQEVERAGGDGTRFVIWADGLCLSRLQYEHPPDEDQPDADQSWRLDEVLLSTLSRDEVNRIMRYVTSTRDFAARGRIGLDMINSYKSIIGINRGGVITLAASTGRYFSAPDEQCDEYFRYLDHWNRCMHLLDRCRRGRTFVPARSVLGDGHVVREYDLLDSYSPPWMLGRNLIP